MKSKIKIRFTFKMRPFNARMKPFTKIIRTRTLYRLRYLSVKSLSLFYINKHHELF